MFRWLKQLLAGNPGQSELAEAIKPHEKRVFGTRDFSLHVVGTSHYRREIEAATAGRKSYSGNRNYIPVVLETEPDNPYDSNAVKVMSVNRETIGYLPREDAAKYASAIRAWHGTGKFVGCDAVVVRSQRNPGVWLDLDAPESILRT